MIFFLVLGELHNFDLIPDPKIIIAGLHACRRINDFALAIRFLEAIKFKCGGPKSCKVMYTWIINEVCLNNTRFTFRKYFLCAYSHVKVTYKYYLRKLISKSVSLIECIIGEVSLIRFTIFS